LLPTLGIEGIFSTYKKTIYIAIYNTSTRILMLLFIVMPVILLKGTYLYAIYGWLVVSVISLAIAWYFKGIPFKNVSMEKAGLSFKEIFKYSLPLVLASLAATAMHVADQFYISRFFGPEVFAEFANGFIEMPFAGMVTGATSLVLMPVFSKAFYEKKGIDDIMATWRSALSKSALIIYPVVVYFIVFATEIVVLLYSEIYKSSGIYFQIKMFLNFFHVIIFAPLFFSMGKTKTYFLIHLIFAVIIWVTHFIIVSLFNSPVLIAVNSAVNQLFLIICFIYWASKLLEIDFLEFFPLSEFGLIFLNTIFSILIIKVLQIHLLDSFSTFLQLAITLISYVTLLLVTSRFFKINYFIVLRPIISKKN
jgi:O-antigen/teichoic acid export membrane protein